MEQRIESLARDGNVEAVSQWLKERWLGGLGAGGPLMEKPGRDVWEALCAASEHGRKGVVEMLLPLCDPKREDSRALRLASGGGHKEIVEMLIPVSAPKQCEWLFALSAAAMRGHKEIVELLIPVSDPKANDSEALRLAKERGHKEIVEMLIPVSGPSEVIVSIDKALEDGDAPRRVHGCRR